MSGSARTRSSSDCFCAARRRTSRSARRDRPSSRPARPRPAPDRSEGLRPSSAIVFGMVAEKNSVCRFAGTIFTIFRSGTMKPRSSIWSASSTTRISTAAEDQMPLVDQVEQPARRGDQDVDAALQRAACGRCETPPKIDGDGEPQPCAVGDESSARPGSRARASASARGRAAGPECGSCEYGASRSRIGSANAAVLPVPVCAMPQRSRPARIGEMDLCLDRGRGAVAFVRRRREGWIRQGRNRKTGSNGYFQSQSPAGGRTCADFSRSGVIRRPARIGLSGDESE